MSASKSYAEAAKPPPSTLKTPKQAAQGASSNNGGRSAVPAQLIPPPNTASHYPPVDSRVEKPEKNQRPKFAAGGKQHPGGRRRGEKQTGSQYEPGTGPPPNKKPTYTARTSTNSMKARDACAVLLGVPKKGGVENRDGNSPKTAKWRSAVEDARSTKPVRGNAKEETAEEEAEAQRAARAAEEEAEAQRAARAAEEEAEAQRAARAAEEEAEAERAARAAEEEAEAERKADEAEMAEMAEYGATMDFLAVQDVPSTGGRITETAPLKPPSELNPLSPFLNPLMWTTAEANAAAENGNGNTEAEMEIDDLILGKTLEEITAKYDALEKHTADAPACNSTDEAPGANAVHGSEVIVVRPGEVSTGGHVANTDADAPTIGLAAQMPDLNPSVQPPEVRTVEDYDRPASGFGNTGFSDTMASKPQMETDASGDRPASGFGNTGFSEDGNAYRGARGGGPIRHNRGGRSSSGAMSHRQPLPGNSVCPTETGFCNTGFTADELQSGAQAFGGSSSQQGTSRGGIGYPQRGGRGGGTGARLCRDRQQPWRIARACQGEPVCGSCYEEGHRTYECTNRGGSGNACYHCNARDHRAPDCPHRQEDDGPGFDENSKCSAPNDANWPYYVIQHGGGHYLAIFDFEKAATKKSGLGHLAENDLPPLVIRIRQDHVVKSSLHPPANMTKPCLTIGTRLHMRKVYRFTRMPEQIIGPTIKAHRLPDFLDPRTKLVNPSGHARMYALTQGPRSWSLPAIVVAIGKTDKRPRVSVRHSKKAVVLPEYSLHLVRGGADGDFTFTEGDVVLVWLTVPPRDGYMHPDSTYMLPAHHPMIDHERERTVLDMEREVFIWQTEPWPADKKLNMSDFFGDKSPATSGFVSESARMYDYGNLLYAANARAHELVQLRRAKGDYRGKLTPIPCEKNNRARVSMVFDEKEQATFVAKTQWWTDHAVFDVHVTSSSHAKKVKAKAAQAAAASQDATTEACEPAAQATTSEAAPVITVASGVPPEKDDANFSHYRCVGVAAIDWVRIDHKGRKIEAGLTFESDVPGEIEIPVKSPLHKVISGRSTTWLRPNDTNTGFKFDFDQLSGGRLSVAYNGSYPCMRPIAAFLRLEKQFDVPGTPRIDDEHPLREPAGKPRKRTAKGHGLHKQKEAADDEQLMDHSGGADADGEANAENMDVAEHTDGTEQQVVSVDECARMEHSDSKAAERGHEQQATVDHVVSGEPLLVFIPAPAGSGITYRSMEHNGSKAQERAREIRDLLERLRNWTPPRPLNDEQQETVDYIVDGEPLVFMSAPPGSGKTYVAAVLAAMLFISWRIVELEEELRLLEAPSEVPAVSVAVTTEHDHPREGDNYVAPEEASAAKKGKKKKKKAEPSVAMLDEHGELKMAGMLQTAETNHATMNLGEAVHETGLFEPDDVLMVISHHYARRHQDEIDAAPWKDYLLVEHLRRILQREEEKLDEKEKDAISDYIEKATSRDAIRVDQSKALTILLQYSRPRIVICTLGIARRIAGKIAPMTKYLVIDEIGQVSEVGFLCLLSALPFVRSVLLAGDHRQLGLYDVEIPKHVRAYGYTSLVEVVTEKRPPKACTKLRKVYRSHPEVVEKVIKPLYDNEVECGIDASARTLLEKIPFASKEFGHVLVIDAKRGQATDKENKSWTNDHHTEITVRFVQSVRKAVPEASVRVLCYYSQQEHEITNELRETAPDVQVHTITSYQGRQADVTVLVTTRTGYDQDPAPEFVLDPQRTTVGLSRLKELLVVVGDVQLLQRGETWRRVLGNLRGNHVLRPSQLKVLLAPIEGEDARPYDHDAEEEEERLGAYAGNAPLVSASASNAPAEEMLANPTTYSAPSALHTSGAQTDAERGATSDE